MRIAGGQNIFVPILQVYNDVTERKKDIMKYRKALTFSYDDGTGFKENKSWLVNLTNYPKTIYSIRF